MIVKVIPQRKEPEIFAQPWEIEHIVELPPGEFLHFKEHLLEDYPFIAEHAKELHTDGHGITHGMLVLCEGIDDGILVNSEASLSSSTGQSAITWGTSRRTKIPRIFPTRSSPT